MRVLHVCLDFFVEPISVWAGPGSARLSGDHYRRWRPEAVTDLLADRFGLDPARPLPGSVVRDHAGPLAQWAEWIDAGVLTAPFDLVCLDAHSNLGATDAGWFHLLGKLVHLPPERRTETAGVTPENYLLFALARNWIRSLTLVAHPQWEPDVLPILFRDADPSSGALELRAYNPHLLERAFEDPDMVEFPPVVSRDPAVPFRAIPVGEYRSEAGFDRMVVSQAVNFTPPAADELLPLLGGYVAGA